MATLSRKHLSQPWFDLILNGVKTHEGRINDGFWKTLQIDDKFIFWNDECTPREFVVQVSEREEFSSFEEAINKIGLSNVLPPHGEARMSIKDAVKDVYYKYFSPQQETNHGVVLFKFNVEH